MLQSKKCNEKWGILNTYCVWSLPSITSFDLHDNPERFYFST